MNGTKSIDLTCPNCNAPPGERCSLYPDLHTCKARVVAAANHTRAVNRDAKRAAHT